MYFGTLDGLIDNIALLLLVVPLAYMAFTT